MSKVFITGIAGFLGSHIADEYIYVNDIQEGIKIYMKLLNHFLK